MTDSVLMGEGASKSISIVPRLKKLYDNSLRAVLLEELNLKNVMQVPKLEKIIIHMCLGAMASDAKCLQTAEKELELITGRRCVRTYAKRSEAAFKIRYGDVLGVKVTLRRSFMYEFLDRFINIVLPRIRDFRPLRTKSFDGNGNFSMGLEEQVVFPEINYDNIDKNRGMDVTICTSAVNSAHALALLKAFNMPFGS